VNVIKRYFDEGIIGKFKSFGWYIDYIFSIIQTNNLGI
jgi:hypothetical protein